MKNNSDSFLNIVCLGVIWISATFGYYLITHEIGSLKIDIFNATLLSATTDIVGYVLGYLLYKHYDISKAISRSFILAFIGAAFLLSFVYAYHGSELVTMSFFLSICKFGLSAAVLLGFIANVTVFKPRIQGTTFGICFFVAYIITLFAPVTTTSNPSWVPLAFLCLFALFGAVIALVIKHDTLEDQSLQDNLDDSIIKIR